MRACAFVVGPHDGPGAALRDMAQGLGFETVMPYGGVSPAEQQSLKTPLLFFLFAAVNDVRTLSAAAEAIRFSPSRKVRFSPLVYFSESPLVEAIDLCIEMGFDDVITLPFTQSRVEQRLVRQIDRPLVYYESPGYFGPDRGDRLSRQRPIAQRGQHRRLEITRSIEAGISVLRDDGRVVV